jgi:hypothetical protein
MLAYSGLAGISLLRIIKLKNAKYKIENNIRY